MLKMLDAGMFEGEAVADLYFNILYAVQLLIALAETILWYIAAFMSLRWMYLAASNIMAWEIPHVKQKPNMCFWNYIIPFWNLFQPYLFMRDICNAVKVDACGSSSWKKLPGPGVLKLWWAAFLLYSIFSRAVFRLSGKDDPSMSYAIQMLVLETVADIADIIAVLSLLVITRRVEEDQKNYKEKYKFRQIDQLPEVLPADIALS